MDKISFPKGETVWVRYCDGDGVLRFIITTKAANRECYFLYERNGEKFLKLGKSRSPLELEEKHKVSEKIRGYKADE